MTNKAQALCQVLPGKKQCVSCNSTFTREQHPQYPFFHPVCPTCGNLPNSYKIRKTFDGSSYEMSYTKNGRRLRRIEDVYKTALEIQRDINEGNFNHRFYQKRGPNSVVSDTVSDYIYYKFLPSHKKKLSKDEKVFIQEFMCPFFEDVGSFVFCDIHYKDFIRTFRFKDGDLEMSNRIYELLSGDLKAHWALV